MATHTHTHTVAITDCGDLLAKFYDEDPQTNAGMRRFTYKVGDA